MNCKLVTDTIVDWLKEQLENSHQKGFVVGVSGGIDSAVTSILCALTKKPTFAISMPIHQSPDQVSRADEHIDNLTHRFENIKGFKVDLTGTFEAMAKDFPAEACGDLALANTRSRIRMTTLYAFANSNNLLVAGTGNKVEDCGVMFFTKYGDGGVDISPIGDLYKSEVYELAPHLGVVESIKKAKPTDGLWGDSRTDEDQIGATYPELEWAMNYIEDCCIDPMTDRQKKVMAIYKHRHNVNAHKMRTPPICMIEGRF